MVAHWLDCCQGGGNLPPRGRKWKQLKQFCKDFFLWGLQLRKMGSAQRAPPAGHRHTGGRGAHVSDASLNQFSQVHVLL